MINELDKDKARYVRNEKTVIVFDDNSDYVCAIEAHIIETEFATRREYHFIISTNIEDNETRESFDTLLEAYASAMLYFCAMNAHTQNVIDDSHDLLYQQIACLRANEIVELLTNASHEIDIYKAR